MWLHTLISIVYDKWQARESWIFYHCDFKFCCTDGSIIQDTQHTTCHLSIFSHCVWSGGRLGLLSFHKMPPSTWRKCRHVNKGVFWGAFTDQNLINMMHIKYNIHFNIKRLNLHSWKEKLTRVAYTKADETPPASG